MELSPISKTRNSDRKKVKFSKSASILRKHPNQKIKKIKPPLKAALVFLNGARVHRLNTQSVLS